MTDRISSGSFEVLEQCRQSRKPGETKNIIVCFDGTGGEPEWAVQNEEERGKVERYQNKGGLSNICKVHLFAGGTVDNSACAIDGQVSLYYKGVGTWAEPGLKASYRAAFGDGAMRDIYIRAYADLVKIHQKGDSVYIFGFSRGAATARLFASYLSKDEHKIGGITPSIAFLGVFDTVVQSSDVGDSEDITNLDVEGKDSSLPECVRRAVHLVSLDDRREPFKPTLFNEDPRVTEVWCPGNHSDIGGGYYHDGLSDACLKCMMKEAELAGMKTRAITPDTPKETIVGKQSEIKNFAEFDKDMKVQPDALEPDIHDENFCFPYRFPLNLIKWFSGRAVRRVKANAVCEANPVLILDSALDRFENYEESVPYFFQYPPYRRSGWSPSAKTVYRPVNLIGVYHKVVTVGANGIEIVEGKVIHAN